MVELKQIWSSSVSSEKEEVPANLAFSSDGSRLVVSRGRRIALYNCNDGTLIKYLKGHKDKVYSVSFSYDDKRIASGGADKSTIIWNEEGKGILKFTHSDSIQVVAYNPVEDLLASCSSSDFGFWSPQEKSIVKHKVESKILCASWRNDGHIIAIGLFSGKVSLYNIYGVEVGIIARNAPVWSLSWNHCSSSEYDGHALTLGSWDMALSFYNEFCQPLNEDYYLDYYPCSVSFFGKFSEYIIVGSSSGTLNLFSEEGIFLKCLVKHDGWIWSSGGSRNKQIVACIDSSGMLSCYQFIDGELVCDKWKKIVGYCNTCSNVVIHDFSESRRRSLKCKGVVESLAISKSQIALVVNSEILFYDIAFSTDKCILEHSIDIDVRIDSIKISVNHLIISTDKILKAYKKTGGIVHQWDFSSTISCIHHLSANDDEETLLIGCEDGKVFILVIDSPFYTSILDQEHPITSIATSCKNRYIGIICDECHLFVFDQFKKSYIQNIKGPKYILFHDEIEYLYCYGNDGVLTVQDIYGSSIVEPSKGIAVNFTSKHISCLKKDFSLERIDINILPFAHHKMKKNNFDDAFEIALLGSADSFFKFLAREALLNSNFSVAKKCYQRLRMPHMVEYVHRRKLEAPQDCTTPKQIKALIGAEIAMMEKRFIEAGDILKKADMTKTLIELFVKMRKFQEAKELLRGEDEAAINYVISKEAVWEEQMENWEKASSLYFKSKCYFKAVDVVGKFKGEGWVESLFDLSENIPDEEIEALRRCCHYLSKEDGIHDRVKHVLIKIKDHSSLMQLYVKHHLWIEVANLFKTHENDIDKSLMVPYADWLALQGDLNEAIAVFRKIDRQDKSIKLLQALIENAILEESFKKVSMLYQTLAKESLSMGDDSNSRLALHVEDYEKLSCHYYAYAIIIESLPDNLISINRPSPENVLNACTYLLKDLEVAKIPRNISIVKVLYHFATNARNLGAFQSARNAFNIIRESYLVPPDLRCELGLHAMSSQTDPEQDSPDIIPICYRCGSKNHHIDKSIGLSKNSAVDSCSTCSHPFIRCFVNFDVLPLIEFRPHNSISCQEALDLIVKCPPDESVSSALFNDSINSILSNTEVLHYVPVEVDQRTLESFNREEIYAIRTSSSNDIRFYKNMIPEIGIAVCQNCGKFFHEEDYEYKFLKYDGCPYCKTSANENYGHV